MNLVDLNPRFWISDNWKIRIRNFLPLITNKLTNHRMDSLGPSALRFALLAIHHANLHLHCVCYRHREYSSRVTVSDPSICLKDHNLLSKQGANEGSLYYFFVLFYFFIFFYFLFFIFYFVM